MFTTLSKESYFIGLWEGHTWVAVNNQSFAIEPSDDSLIFDRYLKSKKFHTNVSCMWGGG